MKNGLRDKWTTNFIINFAEISQASKIEDIEDRNRSQYEYRE